MYKLYNIKTWGSMAPHFLLEELGVPYQNLWMTAEQVRAPEFREISPLGFIPALGLDDGRAIFESAAIVTFLTIAHADKHLAPQPGTPDHGIFLAWLNLMSTNIYPAIDLALPGSRYAETPAQAAFIMAKAAETCGRLFGSLADKLKREGPWLMGAQFSALDLYLFMLSVWARPNEARFLEKFPTIARLSDAVRGRPKLKAALEAHGVHKVGAYAG